MKSRFLIIICTLMLVVTCCMVPKQKVYAFNPFKDGAKLWEHIWGNDKKTENKEKTTESKNTKVDESVDTTSSTSKGGSIQDTDLSTTEMSTTITFSAFQEALSKFVSIIAVVGGFYLAISIIRSIGMFAISIAQLSTVPSYEKARFFLIKNILVSVVCIALLGSVGLLTELITGVVFG